MVNSPLAKTSLAERRIVLSVKDIEGFKGYKISNTGVVFGLKGNIKKQYTTDRGYQVVALFSNGKNNTKRVHRLVLETFKCPCPKGKECNHKNGNKQDNRIENLEWITHAENLSHCFKIGTRSHKGENHNRTKLTNPQVFYMKQAIKKELLSLRNIAKVFNASYGCVKSIKYEKAWGHIIV